MAKYKDAIQWIADNDDTEWIRNDDPISVTACLVADIFDKSEETVKDDITKALRKS